MSFGRTFVGWCVALWMVLVALPSVAVGNFPGTPTQSIAHSDALRESLAADSSNAAETDARESAEPSTGDPAPDVARAEYRVLPADSSPQVRTQTAFGFGNLVTGCVANGSDRVRLGRPVIRAFGPHAQPTSGSPTLLTLGTLLRL